MYTITNKQIIADNIKRIELRAPLVAAKARPGQFVMVIADEYSERIPLSIVESDINKGLITLIFEEVGTSTERLGALRIGDQAYSVLGPLGVPVEIKNVGVVACIGYGAYIAQLLPVCRALRQAGNKVVGIVGAKTKRSLPLENQMRLACNKLFVTTDDGSYEHRGSVIGIFDKVLENENVRLVHTAAPVEMMEMIIQMTRPKKIKTCVWLNPIMIDGIGMCGTSRVRVVQQELSACIDGPVLDGHSMDFHDFAMRLKGRRAHSEKCKKDYKRSTQSALKNFLSGLFGSET